MRGILRGIAASEPVISVAALLIMGGAYNFILPNALLTIPNTYVINYGDREELWAAAFLTQAQDLFGPADTRNRTLPLC